jgi:hypothetical protein
MIATLAMALAASPVRLLRWIAVLDVAVDFSGVSVAPDPNCRAFDDTDIGLPQLRAPCAYWPGGWADVRARFGVGRNLMFRGCTAVPVVVPHPKAIDLCQPLSNITGVT